MVYLMGPQAEEIFNTFKLEPAEQKKFEVALNQYEAYFIPRRNIIYERAKFNTRTQVKVRRGFCYHVAYTLYYLQLRRPA